jgi:hypothetical protein
MVEPQLARPHQFSSSQVLVRFVLRLIFFSVFAAGSVGGFRIVFPTFMIFAAVYCVIAATLRGEAVFERRVLTHWDEAAGYGALACLVTKLSMV